MCLADPYPKTALLGLDDWLKPSAVTWLIMHGRTIRKVLIFFWWQGWQSINYSSKRISLKKIHAQQWTLRKTCFWKNIRAELINKKSMLWLESSHSLYLFWRSVPSFKEFKGKQKNVLNNSKFNWPQIKKQWIGRIWICYVVLWSNRNNLFNI